MTTYASKSLCLSLALLFVGVSTYAQAQDSTSFPWAQHTIQSGRLKELRRVFVALPAEYRTSTRSYPVLVILDADDTPQFNAAIANVRFLASRGATPELIVVGIPNGKDRTHDLTPPATGKAAKDFPTAGGADAFTDFIADEVLPMVRANYRTRPTTIFAGHSFGGLIALHIAATRPGSYTGVIAMSPSLWWNDSTAAVVYSDGIAQSQTAQRVFATSGGLEREIDVTTKRFAARLDSLKPKATAFSYRHYSDDTHGLTPEPSLVDGLRFVFEPIATTKLPMAQILASSDSAFVVNAMLESESRYARGARLLGESEKLPENELNQLGYTVLQFLKMPNLAIWIFRRNVSRYPESANVYDSLGDGLLAMRDTTGAIAEFRRAVDVGTRTKHPVTPESQKKLQALEAAIARPGRPKPE